MGIVPKPDEKKETILTNDKPPIFKSGGADNYFCGSCSAKLVETIASGQIANVFLLCPKCSSYNSIDKLSPKKKTN